MFWKYRKKDLVSVSGWAFSPRVLAGRQFLRGVSSVGRAFAWHAKGQRFESATLHHFLSRKWPLSSLKVVNAGRLVRFFSLMELVGKDLAIACARAAEDIQALDIQLLDVSEVSTITDYMVICSGNSMPHLKAVIREIEKAMAEAAGAKPHYTDGNADSRWVVLDYIDVMVHVMMEESRELYSLEKLWGDAIMIDWSESQ